MFKKGKNDELVDAPNPPQEESPETIAKRKMSGKELISLLIEELHSAQDKHQASIPTAWVLSRLQEAVQK
jgi:hypothetical protein